MITLIKKVESALSDFTDGNSVYDISTQIGCGTPACIQRASEILDIQKEAEDFIRASDTLPHGLAVTNLVTSMVGLSVAALVASGEFSKLGAEINGFTGKLPVKPGIYWMVCDEMDYEPMMVKLTICPDFGYTIVHDGDLGVMPLDLYDLTNLMWKRFSPGAL